ncbi:branched-chain amino acid ABC transporter permease [Paraburkholderia sp. 40]|uniref:branched-chain amino acid ABC transporter permease n=1 Tax=Paraburkholderia sp. 40 TaxID=2991059 RepID=UPI003D19D9AC
MAASAFEAFVTLQCILCIAALGHYLPLSMKQLDLGIAGYMSIGAYTSALLTRDYHVTFELALAGGAGMAAVGALVVDSLATRVRLSGFAYAVFSLSFAESLRIILNNTEAVGATLGFAQIPPNTTLAQSAGILALIVAGFCVLDRTRLGRLKTAIADDEFIVPQLGIPVVATKLTVFALGGGLGGLAGGLYAHYVLFMRPDDFGFALLIAIQLPIVFGGLDRFWGALAGTLLLAAIPELLRELGQFRLLFTAGATLLLLIIRPGGLLTHGAIASLSSVVERVASGIYRRLHTRGEPR